jgi:polar amino acid transport system substrate-binding protein
VRRLLRLLFIPILLTTSAAAQVTTTNPMRSTLAPSGTLRAVFLASNPVQAVVNPQTGEVAGPAADVARELARRIGVPVSITGLDGVPAVMDAVTKRTADIGFLAFDVTRATQVGFSQPYSIGHNTFMVRQDSPIRNVADADRMGVRIGVGGGDAVDLYLTRTLKQAVIVRPANRAMDEAVRMLITGDIDAYAANVQRLTEAASREPRLRLIPGSVLGVEQSIVVAKENQAGIQMLDQFIDELRKTGFLRQAIDRARLAGVEVAPPKTR